MDIAVVRNRLKRAITDARERTKRQRARTAEAERAFENFLRDVAIPITKHVATALKAEGFPFTVFTPGGGLRLAADRGRDDYIEFILDADSERPHVVGRLSYTRGSRTLTEERPVKDGAAPDAISDEDVLAFLLDALTPWIER